MASSSQTNTRRVCLDGFSGRAVKNFAVKNMRISTPVRKGANTLEIGEMPSCQTKAICSRLTVKRGFHLGLLLLVKSHRTHSLPTLEWHSYHLHPHCCKTRSLPSCTSIAFSPHKLHIFHSISLYARMLQFRLNELL